METMYMGINCEHITISEKNFSLSMKKLIGSNRRIIINNQLMPGLDQTKSEDKIYESVNPPFIMIEKIAGNNKYLVKSANVLKGNPFKNSGDITTKIISSEELKPLIEDILFGINENNKADISYSISATVVPKVINTENIAQDYINTIKEIYQDTSTNLTTCITKFNDTETSVSIERIYMWSNASTSPDNITFTLYAEGTLKTIQLSELESIITEFCKDGYTYAGIVQMDSDDE